MEQMENGFCSTPNTHCSVWPIHNGGCNSFWASVEPQGVELGLFLDAGVQFQDLSDCHGGVGGGRQGELHP